MGRCISSSQKSQGPTTTYKGLEPTAPHCHGIQYVWQYPTKRVSYVTNRSGAALSGGPVTARQMVVEMNEWHWHVWFFPRSATDEPQATRQVVRRSARESRQYSSGALDVRMPECHRHLTNIFGGAICGVEMRSLVFADLVWSSWCCEP